MEIIKLKLAILFGNEYNIQLYEEFFGIDYDIFFNLEYTIGILDGNYIYD